MRQQEYIRQEAQTLFRAHRNLQDPEEIEAKASIAALKTCGRPCIGYATLASSNFTNVMALLLPTLGQGVPILLLP